MWNVIYHIGMPEKNVWCHLLTPITEPWHYQLQPQYQQVLGYNRNIRGLKVNKEPLNHEDTSCHWWVSEVTSQPKAANTVKAIEKEGHWHSAGTLPPAQAGQQQLLHLYNETSHSHSKNKGHCYRVNKMHTLVIYCGCVVVFDWKFLCPWCSTKTNDMKKGSTLMCVRALCLVVMVSVDLNCLLWVNHTAFIFSFFRASVFEDSIGWPLPGPLQKISHTRHLSVSCVNLTRPWLPLSSAWKKIRNLISPKIGLGHRSHSYGWLQTDLLFSQFPIKV